MAQRFPPRRAASGTVRSENVDERVIQGEEKTGNRFTQWTFMTALDRSREADMTARLRMEVSNRFKLRHIYGRKLTNNVDSRIEVFYTNKASPWFDNIEQAQNWLGVKEARRLATRADGRTPDSKWTYDDKVLVAMKVIVDRNAPLLGSERLPDWLKNLAHGRQIITLAGYEDNLCVWRCIAVHNGCRPDACTRVASFMARGYFNLTKNPKTFPKIALKDLPDVERSLRNFKHYPSLPCSMKNFQPMEEWLGIRVYTPIREEDGTVIWVLERSPPEALKPLGSSTITRF